MGNIFNRKGNNSIQVSITKYLQWLILWGEKNNKVREKRFCGKMDVDQLKVIDRSPAVAE